MAQDMVADSIVVVTGAAGRLGRRMIERFASRGAILAAVDLRSEAIVLPDDGRSRAFSANMVDEEEVRRCFEEIGAAFGRVDVLLHTVGGWGSKPLLETTLADWQQLVDLNLTSTFLAFREALRLMQERGGQLIAIASGQGADRGRGEQGAYSAAKAGVIRLVEAVAEEFAGTNITVHAIAPSLMLFDGQEEQEGVSADDIVNLAMFLCSGSGPALNGATLRAYGTLR